MPNQWQDIAKQVVLNAVEGSLPGAGGDQGDQNGQGKNGAEESGSGGGFSSGKGLALGAGTALLVPLVAKNLSGLAKKLGVDSVGDLVSSPKEAVSNLTSDLGENAASGLGDMVSGKLDEAGGPSGILKDTVGGMLPGGGGGGGGKGGVAGVGKGRRMPVQQSIDIGLPIETVYNQWTQFEDWPTFMHRVTSATQEDDCTVSFATKIWTRKREFTAKIETQRPNERIKWKVAEGLTHTGTVSFHELGPNLTRVLVGFDLQPGGMIEKIARGARHVKRGARADLHRFKAFIEMAEMESGAWRGVIEDGEVVEEHDPSYDEGREYSDPEDLVLDSDDDEDEEDKDEDDKDENEQDEDGEKEEPRRGRSRASSEGSGRSSRAGSGSGGSSRSKSQSRSGGGSNGGEKASGRSRSSRGSSSGSSRGGSASSGSSRSRGASSGSSKSRSASSGSSKSRSASSGGRGRATRSRGGSSSNGSDSSGSSARTTNRRSSRNSKAS